LGPHADTLVECVDGAWADWLAARQFHTRAGNSLSPTSRATIIYDLVVQRARRAFASTAGVRVSHQRGLFTLHFGNDFVVRFKKLGTDLSTQGIPTAQMRAYEAQQTIPGLPRRATFLVAGYVLDPTGTQLHRIVITCRDAHGLRWSFALLDNSLPNVTPIPLSPKPPTLPILRSKIRPDRTGEEEA
jgi:hypothetical protein